MAYRLAEDGFARWDRFWIAGRTVEPLELVELGERHEAAGIEPRTGPLFPLWDDVVASTLDYSGIRLRNATMAA